MATTILWLLSVSLLFFIVLYNSTLKHKRWNYHPKYLGLFPPFIGFILVSKCYICPTQFVFYAKHCLILKGNIEISLISLTSNKWYINHIDHITILKISLSLIVCDLFDWTTNIFDLINYCTLQIHYDINIFFKCKKIHI